MSIFAQDPELVALDKTRRMIVQELRDNFYISLLRSSGPEGFYDFSRDVAVITEDNKILLRIPLKQIVVENEYVGVRQVMTSFGEKPFCFVDLTRLEAKALKIASELLHTAGVKPKAPHL